MIYAFYNDEGEHIGGCETAETDDKKLADMLVTYTNAMVRPSTHRASVSQAVRPTFSRDFYRYDIMYVEGDRIIEQFFAIPTVIGHA